MNHSNRKPSVFRMQSHCILKGLLVCAASLALITAYSDEAHRHLTFHVIGSRLKPGCAEGRIVSTALDLMHRSGE